MTAEITRDSAHVYENGDGRKYPSVTTITGEWSGDGLVPWARRHAIEYAVENGDRLLKTTLIRSSELADVLEAQVTRDALASAALGTRVHERIEAIIKGDPTVLPMIRLEEEAFIRAFSRFVRQYEPAWLFSELPIINAAEGFGGTVDAGGRFADAPDDYLTVVDFKTSKRTWREHIMQVAAYVYTLIDEGYDVRRGAILQLRPDQFRWKVLPLAKLAPAYEAFKHLKSAYDWQAGLEEDNE